MIRGRCEASQYPSPVVTSYRIVRKRVYMCVWSCRVSHSKKNKVAAR